MLNNTLGERVRQQIRNDIISGKYRPGERLFFEIIAKETGVSMTPVKEAFMLLEKECLVLTLPRKGTFVREFPRRDLEEFCQIRRALELLAADLVCARGLAADAAAELEVICDRLEEHIAADDAGACVMADIRFHSRFVRAGGNAQLERMVNTLPLTNLFGMLDRAQLYLFHGGDYLVEHRRIVRLLRKGDAEAVKKILKRHISLERTEK